VKSGSGALGDLASRDRSGSLPRRRDYRGFGDAGNLREERPLVDNPKKKGKVTVDDAMALVALPMARLARSRPHALRGREELQPVRDQQARALVFNLERMNELDMYLRDDRLTRKDFAISWLPTRCIPVGSGGRPDALSATTHLYPRRVRLDAGDLQNKQPSPNFRRWCQEPSVLDAMEKSAKSKSG
jgi:hypothetical protein